ncbi:MAG: hypothetical protein CVT61_01900 [Actinobacteria bacterium HGW-Actinobacteria-11]|nr:MAG: hypothetical protein CVT61_01900 [Actinobacteria bacterium HGW-Actinobacteria-11]
MKTLLTSQRPAVLAARVALVLLLDAGMVLGSAKILWSYAGTTVADGSWVGQMLCLTLMVVACIARNTVTHPQTSPRDAIAIAVGDILLVVVTIAVWQRTADYFIGWVACFGAFLLLTASLCQFLAALIDQARPAALKAPAHINRAHRLARIATVRLGTLAAAIGLLVAVSGIHEWKLQIFDVLVLLTVSAVLLASAISSWIRALQPRRTRTPQPTSAD